MFWKKTTFINGSNKRQAIDDSRHVNTWSVFKKPFTFLSYSAESIAIKLNILNQVKYKSFAIAHHCNIKRFHG